MSYATPDVGESVNGTLAYDPASDFLGVEAKQFYANWLIGPVTVGSAFQIYLSGVAMALSLALWSHRKGQISRENTVFLAVANLFNSACAVLAMLTFFQYGVDQERSYEDDYSFGTVDSLEPLFQGLVACSVQIFFVRRLEKFIGKIWVAFLLYPFVFINTIGAILTTASQFLFTAGLPAGTDLLLVAPQLWLWTAAATDTTISLILSISLWRSKRGFAKNTDNLIDRIIKFSMGTAAVTTVSAVVGAITYLVFYNDIRCDVYYVFITPLPSIYLLTLVYACSGWGRETSGSAVGVTTSSFAGKTTQKQATRTTFLAQRSRVDGMDADIPWSPTGQTGFPRNVRSQDTQPMQDHVNFVDLSRFPNSIDEKAELEAAASQEAAFEMERLGHSKAAEDV